MKVQVFSRRDLLRSAVVLPLLTCVFRLRASAAAPYLSLEAFIAPGFDEFSGETAAVKRTEALMRALTTGTLPLSERAQGESPFPTSYRDIGPDLREAIYTTGNESAAGIATGWKRWIEAVGKTKRAQVFVLPENIVRYEVASDNEYRVGRWQVSWSGVTIDHFAPLEEHIASSATPWFRDITAHALSSVPKVKEQFERGIPYWRSRLDPASGIDIYGSNGISLGDIDGDGEDESYVSQPGGLPNRLLKFRPDGTVADISSDWGVDLLDDTSCALFLDLRNIGRQDLVVLRASGPVLFLNEGSKFRPRTDAFAFATPPQGAFTGMAAADYDCDGKLDLYLCCYSYFQSEAQYTYPAPYHDAQNGPPNFLFRNELNADGTGVFRDATEESGLGENNNRFSFAAVWCDSTGGGWPDLFVANDFGRKNFYRNRKGKFQDEAAKARMEDIGPGMSASWFDYDGDGRPDMYVANMWTAAGQRVVADPNFKPAQSFSSAYRAHTMGNSLLRNNGDGTFRDVTAVQGAGFGRWAWASGGHDLDNDGNPEIFVTCGMLTNASQKDLDGFFWRQVVARSPVTAQPSEAYENGWNALNQFVRQDYSWSGHEPNVLHVRRGERYYDFSGVSGLDFADDSRAFAVGDFDGDGLPDILLKSRLGPQLRVLQNQCAGERKAIAFRLRGTKSNGDAIGTRVEVDGQTKWLEAGSGFLSQHSKTLLFGSATAHTVRIAWPSGAVQEFADLQTGRTYEITEGSSESKSQPFRERKLLPQRALAGENRMVLEDTVLLEPVPLPSKQSGPGVFVIRESTLEWEIFRRYLFDWRAPLKPPLALELNDSGEVVRILPGAGPRPQVLPYEGIYIYQPSRDFFKWGAAYLWADLPVQALPYLERVLRRDPTNARVSLVVGEIYQDQDRNREAAEAFTRSLQIDPKSPEAANGLGLAQAKLGRTQEARRNFELAISLKRDYADAINNLAVLFSKEGAVNDAVAAWRYGIQVAPDEDILYLNLGRAYVGMGQNDRARQVMQQLLDRKPADETARRALRDLSGRN